MEVREGYEQTSIGLIPSDWLVKPLGEIGVFKKGKGISKNQIHSDGIPCVRYGEIYTHHNEYIKQFNSFIDRDTADKSQKIIAGDLLFTGSGETAEEIGKCVAYLGEEEAYAGGDLIILTPDGFDSKFLGFLLNHNIIVKQKAQLGQGDAVVHIYARNLAKVFIPFPPTKAEQTAIAQVLSDTDELISSLEKLIEKKKLIKQATMQQLLTGKKRLPGFSEGWEEKRLGDIVEIKKGQLITEKTTNFGNIPVIGGGIFPSYFHNTANRKSNTITISASGANAGYISFHKNPIFASDCSTIEECPDYNVKFIFLALLLKQKQIYNLQTGGAQPHVYPEQLKVVSIQFPTEIYEQATIVDIILEMDSEIEILEQKLNKCKSIKQGLMQNLLTGKIRLV